MWCRSQPHSSSTGSESISHRKQKSGHTCPSTFPGCALDPATFKREKRTTVTLKGIAINFLNELEWIGGKLWANVYTTDQIVIIDPATGVVEGVVDLTGLLPDEEVTPTTDVLNGIAYDAAGKRIFVTGKNWSKLFEIEIIGK